MGPDGELERVGRPARPALVAVAWAAALAVVIGAALLGAAGSRPHDTATSPSIEPMVKAAPAVAAVASPRPTPVDRGFPRPFHPTHLGPPVREDRRIDGTVAGTAGAPD